MIDAPKNIFYYDQLNVNCYHIQLMYLNKEAFHNML